MNGKPVIAVCEDDVDIRALLAAYLVTSDFLVETAGDAIELDSVPRRSPVSLITRPDADRVAGLDGDADDYVSKPFNPWVLLSRVNVVLRRGDVVGTVE